MKSTKVQITIAPGARSVFGIPDLSGIFILLLFVNRPLYLAIIREDSLVEWLTFVFLIATGLISLVIAMI